MKKILFLTTGGTIASELSNEGLVPTTSSQNLLGMISSVTSAYEVTARDLFHLDSSNIQPEEWKQIAACIAEEYLHYDGIVLAHGTDTMAYTASALSFMLRNIPIPVVLTGSQLPIHHPLSDAYENLRCAFAMAATGVAGVYVAFNRKIILGARSVKVRTTGFDAFESVNYPYIAQIDSHGLQVDLKLVPPIRGKFSLEDSICDNVFLIKVTPGFHPEIFDMLTQMSYRGLVVEAFGAGGLQFIRRDLVAKLQKAVENGIAVVACSQCLYERSDFSIYQTGQKALRTGILQGVDMTTEAAVTKLMWALGQTEDPEEVRRIFTTSYVGEISVE